MVPQSAPIARVDGVFNAVVAEGDFVGRVMLEGRGAGAGPTASAVVADLIDIARNRITPVWGAASAELSNAPSVPMSAHVGAYYLRLMVVDRPGVIADVTAVLRDLGVSLESMLQRGRAPGEAVPVVLVTHETQESAMREALTRIAALDAVLEAPNVVPPDAVHRTAGRLPREASVGLGRHPLLAVRPAPRPPHVQRLHGRAGIRRRPAASTRSASTSTTPTATA